MVTQAVGVQIFFDASLAGAAKIMAPTDARIVHPGHPSWPFQQDEADEIWLPYVGGDNWLTILRDRKVRYRNAQRAALVENRVRAINLATKANLDVQATVDLLHAHWPTIEATLNEPPAFYHLTRSGLAEMLGYA